MNIIVLWLLITPVFFALGWIAGRIDMKTVIGQAKQLPKRLYHSIEALIENKGSIARDNLSEIIEKEPQLTELQIALGKLYRNRGENDLAIKLHTTLLNSQYIFSSEEKDLVKLELAKDFGQAGLVDRAESLLLKLLDSDYYGYKAQELLLNIYQQDKNWKEAIVIASKLATKDYAYNVEVAEFNCELAQESLFKSAYDEAITYANTALSLNKKCVRANLILGETYFNQENYANAITTWQLIEKQNYLYLPMVVDKLFDAYLKLNQIKAGINLIKGYATLYPNLNLYDFVCQLLINYDSIDSALEYLRGIIKTNPNSKVAALLVDLRARDLSSFESKQDAEIVKNILLKYNEKLSSHRCGRCNFKAKTFFWQCPACYEWESISPNNSEL